MSNTADPNQSSENHFDLLKAGEKLKYSEIEILEASIVDDPLDVNSRFLLMGFYNSHQDLARFEEPYLVHIRWMITNCPEDIGLNWISFDHKNANFLSLKREWIKQCRKFVHKSEILHNAARFCAAFNPRISQVLWTRAKAAAPMNEVYPRELCSLYASLARSNHLQKNCFAQIAFDEAYSAYELHNNSPHDSYLDTYGETIFNDLAELALQLELIDQAKRLGSTLVKLAPFEEILDTSENHQTKIFKHRYAAHKGHSVLGRACLKELNAQKAVSHLISMTKCPLPLSPDSKLALALIEAGENQAAIEYFSYCQTQLTFEIDRLNRGCFEEDSLQYAILKKLQAQGIDQGVIKRQWKKQLEEQSASLSKWLSEIQ